MNKKKIVLLPGTGQSVNNYEDYIGVEIWMTMGLEDELRDAEYIIGHSLGASFALAYNKNPNCKFILINPLVHKKSLSILILRWIKFMFSEGFEMKKAVPLKYWPHTFRQALGLVRIDVLSAIRKFPKDNIFIIRGKKDNFFCDNKAVEILRGDGFKFIEVDAGHDWNGNIAEAVKKMMQI